MTIFAEPLLKVRGLAKSYVQRRPFTRAKFTVRAFEDVNLKIRRCSTVALIGESGAGKSSLARCLAFLDQPSQGEIWWEGQSVLGLAKSELFPLRRQIQLIFQDPAASLNPRFTAWEIIAEPLMIQREGTSSQRRARAISLMKQVGLSPDSANKRPFEFSGGQRQRLAIARALALEPKLLILDEALSSLDIANQELILGLLADLQATRALTYLHISHDLRLISQFAREVAVMHQGKIVEQQSARALFACPLHSYTQDLLAAMPSLESILEERSA
jgi:ABC-type glutathione transport system ATPase component